MFRALYVRGLVGGRILRARRMCRVLCRLVVGERHRLIHRTCWARRGWCEVLNLEGVELQITDIYLIEGDLKDEPRPGL